MTNENAKDDGTSLRQEAPEVVTSIILGRDEQQERALLDVQVSTAKRYRREMPVVRNRILSLATVDEETAVACFYGLKPGPDGRMFTRGGKAIVGESVRMAEIVASSYGNMRVQSEVVRTDEHTVTCRARCWDLEANYAVESEVVRRILTGAPTGDAWKDGQRREDAVALASMSGQAIARRTVIFNVVPPATLRSVFGKIKESALGKAATLGERRGSAVQALKQVGVELDAALRTLGKPATAKVEDIDLEDLLVLRGWYEAIREGTSTVAEIFGGVTAPSAVTAAAAADAAVATGAAAPKKMTKEKKAPAAPAPKEEKPAETPATQAPATSSSVPEGAV